MNKSRHLIYDVNELSGSLYFEFLPGEYQGYHWNEESVFLKEEVFVYIEYIIKRYEANVDHHSFNAVYKESWELIIAEFETLTQELIQVTHHKELEAKLGFISLEFEPCFSNNFRLEIKFLSNLLKELSDWLRERLKSYDVISVLGM